METDDVQIENAGEEDQKREEYFSFINELQQKILSRNALRAENTIREYPGESHFAKLDSSLKKNTAFVKKLKQFTSTQLEVLLKDMAGLNLTKYISEICSALSEVKLKMTDVTPAVILCSKLHQTYNDFDSQFFEAWQKTLSIKPTEKISNPSKMRVDLRFFAELVSCGVINSKQGLSLLGTVLINIISQDKQDHSNFPIILSFCRHCGEEYAGLVPRKMLILAGNYDNVQIPKSDFLVADKQQNLRMLLKDYFKNLCQHLQSEQAELANMTKNIRLSIELRGEISPTRKKKCEVMQTNFDKLYMSAQTLADLLNEHLPEIPKEIETPNPGSVYESILDNSVLSELDPWGDEETKSFYTDLPDLRQFLPNFSAPKVDLEQIEEPIEMTEEALDADIDAEIDLDDPPSTNSDPPNEKELDTLPDSNADDIGSLLTNKLGNPLMDTGKNSSCQHMCKKYQFNKFLMNLSNCVSKETVDSAAIDYLLNFNTKNNRKKLVKTIFGVQRTRLDLLPFLSRFVAIVNLCNPDVATELSELLRKELKWHIRKKNQLNIESKIKIVRFIGEMVKFGLCKKFEALGCLKMLLRDFHHHQIEMACAFIEVAGVYLYNCRDSRTLTNIFLDQMMRLNTATALDSRYVAQIESVYYLVKPPESIKQDVILRSPIQEYIRHLIFEELCKQNVDRCIKMMRRINWGDPDISAYAIKCLTKAYLLRFPLIRCLADLVSGLSSYQERAVAMVIDNVFEDIRAGLEIHSPKMSQRRIAMAKYLGELYNYKLIEATHILNTLYSVISLGVYMEEGIVSELDPPDSLFRLKLACILLDTCAQYFTNSISSKKLDYFLVFFQHYYWFKKSNPIFSKVENTNDLFPILVDHMYRDCLINVRPKLKQFKNLEESKEAIIKLKGELYPHLIDGGTEPIIEESSDGVLEPIPEDSELDESIIEDSSSGVGNRLSNQDAGDDDNNYTEEGGNGTDLANYTDCTESELMMDETERRSPEKTTEDIEFEKQYEKMASESYQERLRESIKPNAKDIPVPMMARSSKKSYEQISSAQTLTDAKDSNNSDVTFVLMVRGGKGGKQQFKQFVAPSDSHLARNLKLHEEKIREEKEKVKRLTLNITERIEEEDYQESLLQNHRNVSQNSHPRQNKPKFKHQRGAPDADLIFN